MNSGPQVYRRSILIYVAAIVAPAAVLLWLGIQTFERQREAYMVLAREKLSAELESRTRTAVVAAFADHHAAIAKYFFAMEHGEVVQPVLHTPPRLPVPEDYAEADYQEFVLNRPDLAVESYRKLLISQNHESFALSGIA